MPDGLSTLTKKVLFSPLNDFGRTETVVGRIRSAIMLGIFADGEQLPNELDLAGQLQVSPVTLRDALRVIREEGLARTRRGRSGGTFVIAPDESNLEQFKLRLAKTPTLELRDLLDWHAAITVHSARLAASRASNHEVEQLQVTLKQLFKADTAPQARRLVSRFLIELASSSRSSKLSKELIMLQIEVAPHVMLVFRDVQVRNKATTLADDLVTAIISQDPTRSSEKGDALLEFLNDRILELRHALINSSPTRFYEEA